MRQLITFLWRNYFFFLFAIFEVLSILLVVNNNYYQRSVMINSTSDLSASLLKSYTELSTYFELKQINEVLATENTAFHNQSPSAFILTDTNKFFLNDTMHMRQFFYMSARVISNSISRRNNFLKLNKGRIHGVETDMAVISPDGVVGQVVEVSDHFCSVMSVLNMNTHISARLKKSGQVGTLQWDGYNYRHGKLLDIPSHVHIQKGDTVVTSGFSHIYPRDELLGVVNDFTIGQGDNFFRVDISFSVDYNALSYVYIVKNMLRGEIEMLEQKEFNK